jgi:hypothetical protein
MTREQVYSFSTKTTTHYRDLNPGPLFSKSGPQTTRPAGRQDYIDFVITIHYLSSSNGTQALSSSFIHTYHTSLIPEEVAEASQIFFLSTSLSSMYVVKGD